MKRRLLQIPGRAFGPAFRRWSTRTPYPPWGAHDRPVGLPIARRVRDTLAVAGFLKSIPDGQKGVDVTYRVRSSHRIASFETDWIVNCTGMERAGISHCPLLTEMLEQGMISADSLGLGIAVDEDSRVLDQSQRVQPRMFAVVP